MIHLVLAAVLTAGASPWPDGTLLYLENSNRLVSGVTDSEVTHVAMVMHESSKLWVYEATPAKVRRTPLPDYLKQIAQLNRGRRQPIRVFAAHPRDSYSEREVARMKEHLDAQVGRRYSVKGYVRDKPVDGVHCSELASYTLNKSGRFRFTECHQITPGRLVNLLTVTYQKPVEVATPKPPKLTWCESTWECWNGFMNWCGWACVETWTFCH